jgi:hypothetical protein
MHFALVADEGLDGAHMRISLHAEFTVETSPHDGKVLVWFHEAVPNCRDVSIRRSTQCSHVAYRPIDGYRQQLDLWCACHHPMGCSDGKLPSDPLPPVSLVGDTRKYTATGTSFSATTRDPCRHHSHKLLLRGGDATGVHLIVLLLRWTRVVRGRSGRSRRQRESPARLEFQARHRRRRTPLLQRYLLPISCGLLAATSALCLVFLTAS